MDIFVLLDELEQEIEMGKKVPLSNRIMVERERILDYIDRMRGELPEEMRQARWIVREKDRLMEEARAEAQSLMDNAKTKVKELAQESEVVREAKFQSEEIIADAHRVSTEIKNGANQYADEVFANVEQKLSRTLTIIEEGRNELKSRLAAPKEFVDMDE